MFLLNDIISKLTNHKIYSFRNSHINILYSEIKLICGSETEVVKNNIYIGKASMLNDCVHCSSDIGLILINDCHFDFSLLNMEVVEFPCDTDIFRLFNDVQNIFNANRKIIESSAALLNSLIRGRGLNYIVQIGSEILGNPVILTDNSYKLLAFSTDREVDDPVWRDLTTCGYCSYTFVETFKSQKLIEKLLVNKLPILADFGVAKDMRRILGKVLINDKIVGQLGVLENNQKFKEGDIEITGLLCDVISSELQKNKLYKNLMGVMHENLILDLLDERVEDMKMLEERVKSFHWDPYINFYMMTVNIHKDDITVHFVEYLRRCFESFLPSCKTVYYNDNICILLNFKNIQDLQSIENGLITLFDNNNLTAGISLHFTNIIDIRKYYLQSDNALKLGILLKKGGSLFKYDDLYIYHLLNHVDKNATIKDFCNPSLFKLLKYDKSNGTDYFNSLYQYLLNGSNIICTAKKLYIHRNTMAYRINKICEITGINLNDGEDCFKVFLSYKILDLLKIEPEFESY